MNTYRHHKQTCWLERLPIVIAAILLLRATWLPVIEIKGFDTFSLDSIALWATRGARVTLCFALPCLMLRSLSLSLSRWWMALAVGILFSPLTDMAVRATDLAKMMESQVDGGVGQLVVLRQGTWFCVVGLLFWLIDCGLALLSVVKKRPSS